MPAICRIRQRRRSRAIGTPARWPRASRRKSPSPILAPTTTSARRIPGCTGRSSSSSERRGEAGMTTRRIPPDERRVAGNGLLDRRLLLGGGLGSVAALAARPATAREELAVEPWMQEVGSPFVGYGQPSKFEDKVARVATTAPGTTGTGASRVPLHRLDGTITPNGLHFERHHSGIPEIDPAKHRLLIHGLVKRPLVFTLEALDRYPMESRIAFIECGGNSGALYQKDPAQLGVQALHGLVSGSEWTGVRLATLLDEARVDPEAQWILAAGADAARMSRSVPLAQAMD